MRFQSKQINKEIYTSVRRAIAQNEKMMKLIEVSTGGGDQIPGEQRGEIFDAIQSKANHEDITKIQMQKANKIDIEMCLRWVDLLHKMVNQIMLLLTLKFKSELE